MFTTMVRYAEQTTSLISARHGDRWILASRYTRTADISLTINGRRNDILLASLLNDAAWSLHEHDADRVASEPTRLLGPVELV